MERLLKKENIFSYKSKKPGTDVCILAGIHGNEKDGINAIKYLTKNFSINRGKVTFVIANQQAIDENVRFVEENLNRCFKQGFTSTSYEYKLAQELKPILQDHDICLDLHNSTNPNSEPFIICEENAFKYINNINAKKVVSGFDTYEPGGTDYYMNLIKKIGICVECGSLTEDGIEFTKDTIKNFLITTKNIDGIVQSYEKDHYDLIECFIPKGPFKLNRSFDDFEFIKRNEIIGFDNNTEVKAKDESYILFAKSIDEVNTKNKEAYLLAKRKGYSNNYL